MAVRSSLFCYASDGTVIWCTLNYPGSWADGDLAKQLYLLLDELPEGMAIAVDSAFCHGDMAGKILCPLKTDKIERY